MLKKKSKFCKDYFVELVKTAEEDKLLVTLVECCGRQGNSYPEQKYPFFFHQHNELLVVSAVKQLGASSFGILFLFGRMPRTLVRQTFPPTLTGI